MRMALYSKEKVVEERMEFLGKVLLRDGMVAAEKKEKEPAPENIGNTMQRLL